MLWGMASILSFGKHKTSNCDGFKPVMKKLALILLGVFLASPAIAQNVQCTTRPLGDSTNACASTAFVQNAINSGTGFATLAGNNIFTGFNTFAPLAATNPAVTINPLAGSLGIGLEINQTGAGTYSTSTVGGPVPFGLPFNFINITDAVNGPSDPSYITMGLGILLATGGSNVQGTRTALYAENKMTAATNSANPNRFYAGAGFVGRAEVNDGGTVGSPQGAIFGAFAGYVFDNANSGNGFEYHYFNATALELDTNALENPSASCVTPGVPPCSTIAYKTIIQMAGGGGDVVHGAIEGMIAFSSIIGGGGWNNILLLTDANGQQPVTTTGCVLCAVISGSHTIGTGIDLSLYTISGNFLKSATFAVNGAGDISARSAIFTNSFAGAAVVYNINENAAGQSFFEARTNSATNLVNFGLLDNAGNGIGIISAGSSVGTMLLQMNSGTTFVTLTKTGGVAIGTAVDCGANCLNSPSLRVNNVPVSTTTGTVTSVTCSTGLTCTAANPIVGAGTIAITGTISAGGPTGSATVAPIITYNAQGQLTAVSSATITPAASSITGGAALTKTDDTNVTLALGGTPTTALLQATSITVGWSGQLSVARGGTNCSAASITCFNNITGLGASGTTGTTSSNLVFSASPTFTGTIAGTPTIASAWTWSTAQVFPNSTAIGFAANDGAATGQKLLILNGGNTNSTDGACIIWQLAGATQATLGNNDACLGGGHTADILLYTGTNPFKVTSLNFNLTTGGAATFAATVKTGGYTVATLPAGTVGMTTYVTDADACTFLTTVVHTVGAVTCPVFYDGTTWKGG